MTARDLRRAVTAGILIILVLLTGFILGAGCIQKTPADGVITTDAGSVAGTQENGIRVYRGIPYAAPPTGDLRWKPPAPVQPWSGVLDATKFGAICPQVPTDPTPGQPAGTMSEDCLSLNVWTPAQSGNEQLPVMVFIHGGAFLEGAGSLPLYDGSALAKKGVVVVTLNYRLGSLGFLAHPGLANESVHNSSGNYGLLDQAAALRWVRSNIRAFGGDPARVTVFGESAGATSILTHIAIPGSRGLFDQAIVESGPLWTNGSVLNIVSPRDEAEQYGLEFARSLNCSCPDAIRCMRTKDAMALINATPRPASAFWLTHTLKFKPTVDGWLIPAAPDDLFTRKAINPVPLIIGTNADEGTTLATNANMTVTEYRRYLKGRFGEHADQILEMYPAQTPDEVQFQLERIMNDFDFAVPAKYVAGTMAGLNQSTYLYRFSYVIPGQSLGAFHGSELFFVFRPSSMKPDPVSSRVADIMMDLWVRFATTGNPNGGMNVTWPSYSEQADRYLDIGEFPVVKTGY